MFDPTGFLNGLMGVTDWIQEHIINFLMGNFFEFLMKIITGQFILDLFK